MADFIQALLGHYNNWAFILLLMIGFYAMIAKNNLIKKVIGMSIFQTAIILFYVSMAVKKNSTIPILDHGHGAVEHAIDVAAYASPLPHVLMLTAIVVGVATLGVALAIIQKIHRTYDTIEEDEIMEIIAQ
ncbi:MAG: cation:proton antiporter subunit C [Desulfoarculaceae bacterium]|nr:cation:proton antiporter subunit C [Desulfoarculaceae bacterium]